MRLSSIAELRAELAWLRIGALPPLILDAIRKLEIDIAWREHAKLTDPRMRADS